MSLQIIKRREMQKTEIETIDRIRDDAPQISYSSEGRIAIRIPQSSGDTLVVLDRPLTKELIRFIKNGVQELPTGQSWCSKCADEFNSQDLPF
jgi:hypothetical protein